MRFIYLVTPYLDKQNMQETTVFQAEAFWIAFQNDLVRARARVLIQSPFVAARRIDQLWPLFKSLSERNVRVCLFAQKPPKWENPIHQLSKEESVKNEEMRDIIAKLEAAGIHVSLRPAIHEKLAIIDSALLWEGSLNILSHHRTSERMRRIRSQQEAQATVVQYFADR